MADGYEPRPVSNDVLHLPKLNFALALFDGNINISVPYQGNFTHSATNASTISASIYGTIGNAGCTLDVHSVGFSNKSLSIIFRPSVTLAEYTNLGKGFMLELSGEVSINLS